VHIVDFRAGFSQGLVFFGLCKLPKPVWVSVVKPQWFEHEEGHRYCPNYFSRLTLVDGESYIYTNELCLNNNQYDLEGNPIQEQVRELTTKDN
jgi:hypothetical protein